MTILKTYKREAIILLALIVITFGRSLFYDTFYYDDTHSIVDNVSVHSLSSIPSFWTDASTSSFIIENRSYRPLNFTFYAICWALGGGHPFPFHVMKLWMHFFVSFGLFLIWMSLWSYPGWFPVRIEKIKVPFFKHPFHVDPQSLALVLASIFAIHTACSECVDYVSATSSLQCAAFYVWAFVFYLSHRVTRSAKTLALSLFLYFLAVGSKEEGITLPGVIFLLELFLSSGPWYGRLITSIRRAIPYFLTALLLGFWLYWMHPQEGNLSRGALDPWTYFITQWRAYLWYMRLWFWPWDLNADNLVFGFSHSVTEGPVIQALIGNIFLLCLGWILRKKYPAFLFGLLWFYITISPASSVVVLAEPVNEHRMYLSYVGFAGGVLILVLALFEGILEIEKLSRILAPLYICICIGLFIGSQERNWVWANNKNLWTDTVEKNPESGRAMNNLALVHMGEGAIDKGIALVEKCEKIWGEYMYCPLNRGLGYLTLAENARMAGRTEQFNKDLEQARISLERARELNPLSVHTNYHLGRYFQDFKSDCNKARTYYETAVQLNGNRFPNGQAKLAGCLRKLGEKEKALELLNSAYSLEPNNELVLSTLGDLYFESSDLDKALQYYQQLINTNPGKASGYVGLSLVAVKKKDLSLAAQGFKRWSEISPSSLQALVYLGVVQRKMGDSSGFQNTLADYYKVNSKAPDFNNEVSQLEKSL